MKFNCEYYPNEGISEGFTIDASSMQEAKEIIEQTNNEFMDGSWELDLINNAEVCFSDNYNAVKIYYPQKKSDIRKRYEFVNYEPIEIKNDKFDFIAPKLEKIDLNDDDKKVLQWIENQSSDSSEEYFISHTYGNDFVSFIKEDDYIQYDIRQLRYLMWRCANDTEQVKRIFSHSNLCVQYDHGLDTEERVSLDYINELLTHSYTQKPFGQIDVSNKKIENILDKYDVFYTPAELKEYQVNDHKGKRKIKMGTYSITCPNELDVDDNKIETHQGLIKMKINHQPVYTCNGEGCMFFGKDYKFTDFIKFLELLQEEGDE